MRATAILHGDDMRSVAQFAMRLGTTRATVKAMRQRGQVLGLGGAAMGFRFPVWQLDANDEPFEELPNLHQLLGGAWAVYRFLVQPQGELAGLTGREALQRRMTEAVLAAAESVGRDFC